MMIPKRFRRSSRLRRPAMIEQCEPRRLLSTDVLTSKNDLSRDGADTTETQLTLSNVNVQDFGKKFSLKVDGQVYAQPLVVSGLAFARGRLPTIHRNMVYVAIENDTIYAFDADRGQLIWAVRTLGTSFGETAIPASDTGSDDLTPQIGITATPVIDRSNNTIYAVAQAKRGSSTYITRLYALNLLTGAKMDGGPVIVQANVAGSGTGSNGSSISFQSLIENQRSALTLINGNIFFAFASHGDLGPYHGWVLGYDENTLAQVVAWNDTPDGNEGGIWMSGAGLAADSSGNLFIATGNGVFDANTGGDDWGDSLVKIPTDGSPFEPTDSFTPFNQAMLEGGDLDFGSTGVTMLPGDLALVGGKQGLLYLVSTDNLGGFGNGVDNIVQTLNPSANGGFDTAAFFNNTVYYGAAGNVMQSFSLSSGTLTDTGQTTPQNFAYPGANPSISSNGTSNGIVWTIANVNGIATLEAFDASNISRRIFDSANGGKADRGGTFVKFTPPTIANGKVFVAAAGELDIYGLL